MTKTIKSQLRHGTMNWLETRLSPFESDWMALHRFLWLNALSGAAFWSILMARAPTRAGAIRAPQDFGAEMQKWAATAEAGRSISHKSVNTVLGDRTPLFADFSAIRYCPECLAGAFHSHIFQVTTISKSPVHGRALLTTCQHCGASMKGTALRPASFAQPLSCDFCARSWAADLAAMVAGDHQTRATQIFSELTRDFLTATSSRVRCKGLLEHEARLPRFSQIYCQAAFDAAFGPSRSRSLFGKAIVERCSSGDRNPASKNWSNLTFCQQLHVNIRTLKSIDRTLASKVLGICKHRRPAALDITDTYGRFSELQHYLVMRPTDCPCCVALTWWRAEVSMVVALANRVDKLENQGWIVADREGYYGREFSLHPKVFPLAVLSTFTRMAHVIVDIVELRGCSGSSAVEARTMSIASVPAEAPADGTTAHPALSRPIELPITRHGLEPSTIEVEFQGQWSEYACTLEVAIAALRQTMLRRQGGPQRRRTEPPGPTDKWYSHLGEYSLGSRRDADWLLLSRRASAEGPDPTLRGLGSFLEIPAGTD